MLSRRKQIAIKAGTEGTYDSGVQSATYAKMVVEDLVADYDVISHERNPQRATIGSVADVTGRRMANLSFKSYMHGSGTAGVEPAWATLLKACGYGVTTATGTAAVGTVTADPNNPAGATVAVPVISGTYTGTKSGRLELTISEVTANTSILVDAVFRPADGTAASADQFTQNSTSAVALTGVAAGLSFDFGDPDADTTGMVLGARYFAVLTSDQTVSNTYKRISTAIPCVDIAVYEDGIMKQFHSCRGDVDFSVSEAGAPVEMSWSLQGVINAIPADTSMLSGIAYEDVIPPSFKGVTATLFSATPQCFNAFEIKSGNEVGIRECATGASGVYAARITGYRMTGSINPVGALVATVDPWTGLFAGTTGNLSLAWGATAGNIITITAPKVQRLSVKDGDRDGEVENPVEFLLAEPDYDAGADYSPIVITLT